MIVNGINYNNIIHAMAFTPWGRHIGDPTQISWGGPILFIGKPGAAKTSVVRDYVFNRIKHPQFYCLKPGAKGDGAFGVVPMPIEIMRESGTKEHVLTFPMADWTLNFGHNHFGFLFLDEMNTAAPALQTPLLGLLSEKEYGSGFLGPKTRIMGACNSVSDAGGGWDLAPAVANRLIHIDWPDPPEEEWAAGLLTEWNQSANTNKKHLIDPEEEEARVLTNWSNYWASAAALMGSFTLRKRLHREVLEEGDPRLSGAFVSPRTKHFATRCLAAASAHDLSDAETGVLIRGCCGESFAIEFTQYRKSLDLGDPRAFLEGREKFKHNPARIDRTAAFVNACAALIAPENCPDRLKLAAVFWNFLAAHVEQIGDVIAAVVMDILRGAGLTGMPEAQPVISKLRPIITATDLKRRGTR